MAKYGKFDARGIKELQKKLEKLQDPDAFAEACAKELAQRLLEKVIKRTPVGDYSDTYDLEDDGEHKFLVMSDKEGGDLRRAWTAGRIYKKGTNYVIEIRNSMTYASYVEFGHRQTPGRYVPAIGKRLKKYWVQGKFMMTISEQELQSIAPKVLEKKIRKYLGDCLK